MFELRCAAGEEDLTPATVDGFGSFEASMSMKSKISGSTLLPPMLSAVSASPILTLLSSIPQGNGLNFTPWVSLAVQRWQSHGSLEKPSTSYSSSVILAQRV